MLQRVDLRVDLLVHLLIAMPHADRNNPAEEIEILFPIRIPNVLILRVRDHERLFEIVENRRKQEFLLRQQDLLLVHICLKTVTATGFSAIRQRQWKDREQQRGQTPRKLRCRKP